MVATSSISVLSVCIFLSARHNEGPYVLVNKSSIPVGVLKSQTNFPCNCYILSNFGTRRSFFKTQTFSSVRSVPHFVQRKVDFCKHKEPSNSATLLLSSADAFNPEALQQHKDI